MNRLSLVSNNDKERSPINRWGLPADAEEARRRFTGERLVALLGEQYRDWWLDLVGYLSAAIPPEPWSVVAWGDGRYLWIIRRDLWPPPTSKGQQNIYLRAVWKVDQKPGDPPDLLSIHGFEWEYSDVQLGHAQAAIDLFQKRFRIGAGGRPKGRRTLMDDETWLQYARNLRQSVQHDHIHMRGAIARLELDIDDRTGRRWLAELNKRESTNS